MLSQVATDNQGALAETLEKLLRQLRLPPASARTLAAPNFTPTMQAPVDTSAPLLKSNHDPGDAVSFTA